MSELVIRVKCPACGAGLKVPRSYAGKRGKCPKCEAVVVIPIPGADDVSEDDILDVLGSKGGSQLGSRYAAGRDDLPLKAKQTDDHVLGDSGEEEDDSGSSLMKLRRCPKCNKQVPPSYSVCPHCSMYLTEGSVVDETATTVCEQCGAVSFPGQDICAQCGAQLFLKDEG